MKLLILVRYTRLGASTRLRTLQYLPYLEAAGIEVEVASFFDDAYLEALYAGRRSKTGAIRYFIGRLAQLRAAAKADVIWMEKEALPWMPWPVERALMPKAVPLVTDYDDAVFHTYDTHRSGLVRRVLGRKIDRVMAASTLVFAGNDYLAARARTAGAGDIRHIPTVVNVSAYVWRPDPAADGKPRVGWIGTPKTWAEYCVPMQVMLSDVVTRNGAVFRAIGANAPAMPLPGFEFARWSEDTEIHQIQGLDIGIMPLNDSLFARGKCAYKLIQYMACGLPVVASPVGVNREVVEHGVNGFLASTEAEWRAALTTLLENPELRRKMGEANRKKVLAQYSIQSYGPRVAEIFGSLAKPGSAV